MLNYNCLSAWPKHSLLALIFASLQLSAYAANQSQTYPVSHLSQIKDKEKFWGNTLANVHDFDLHCQGQFNARLINEQGELIGDVQMPFQHPIKSQREFSRTLTFQEHPKVRLSFHRALPHVVRCEKIPAAQVASAEGAASWAPAELPQSYLSRFLNPDDNADLQVNLQNLSSRNIFCYVRVDINVLKGKTIVRQMSLPFKGLIKSKSKAALHSRDWANIQKLAAYFAEDESFSVADTAAPTAHCEFK